MTESRSISAKKYPYVIVFSFMTNELSLSGAPLLLYARIFGFWAADKDFYESKANTARILGTDVRTVFRARKSLLQRNLIVEHERDDLKANCKAYSINEKKLPDDLWEIDDEVMAKDHGNLPYDTLPYGDMSQEKPSGYDNLSPPPMADCHPIRKENNKHFNMKGGP